MSWVRGTFISSSSYHVKWTIHPPGRSGEAVLNSHSAFKFGRYYLHVQTDAWECSSRSLRSASVRGSTSMSC